MIQIRVTHPDPQFCFLHYKYSRVTLRIQLSNKQERNFFILLALAYYKEFFFFCFIEYAWNIGKDLSNIQYPQRLFYDYYDLLLDSYLVLATVLAKQISGSSQNIELDPNSALSFVKIGFHREAWISLCSLDFSVKQGFLR